MSSSSSYTIRPGAPEDVDPILDLVKTSLGEGSIPRQREYWEWKHRLNPFGESPVLLAEAGGKLVGLRVFMRWAWTISGTRFPTVRAVDTATHPDWRGRGIFSALTMDLVRAMRDQGVHFVFNTPNDQSRPGYLKMGWQQVGRTDLMIRPLNPFGRVGGLVGARSGPPSGDRGSAHSDAAPRAGDVLSNPEVVRFLAELPPVAAGRLYSPIDPDYLCWRYAMVPGIDYYANAAMEGEDGALVVFRIRSRGSTTEIRVCELIYGPSNNSAMLARELLRRLQHEPHGDYISIMASPLDANFGMLLKCGFIPAPRLGPILTVLPLNDLPGGVDPLSRRYWRPSIGSLELF